FRSQVALHGGRIDRPRASGYRADFARERHRGEAQQLHVLDIEPDQLRVRGARTPRGRIQEPARMLARMQTCNDSAYPHSPARLDCQRLCGTGGVPNERARSAYSESCSSARAWMSSAATPVSSAMPSSTLPTG